MNTLGDRMKQYESSYDFIATRRVPMIIRLDGRKFSKLVKKINVNRPFDEKFSELMVNTTRRMASDISGCVFAYTQSDEISFVIRNDTSVKFEPFFGNRIQKICSITASMATSYFVREFIKIYPDNLIAPMFDSRVFILPNFVEVTNYLIWRQQDAVRNSILNSTYYELAKLPDLGKKQARKMMYGLNTKQLQELLFKKTGINWNNYDRSFKNGVAIFKKYTLENDTLRSKWEADACVNINSPEGKGWIEPIINPVLQ